MSRRDQPSTGGPEVVPPPSTRDFDQFYAAHFVSLTTQLYAYFGDRQEAQDVVQEAFCRGWARWRQICEYDEPVAWVRRVAWNLAISNVRRSKVTAAFRRRYQPESIEPPSPDRVALISALKRLPDSHRRAIVLHYLADLARAPWSSNTTPRTGREVTTIDCGGGDSNVSISVCRRGQPEGDVHYWLGDRLDHSCLFGEPDPNQASPSRRCGRRRDSAVGAGRRRDPQRWIRVLRGQGRVNLTARFSDFAG